MSRYARQTVLPEVGAAGQARLRAASVLVVGAGGLGCPVLQYLAGAGVGRIVVIDPDIVEAGNLHRQPLYRTSSLGQPKAEAAREALRDLNPEVTVEALVAPLDPSNVGGLLAGTEVALDCADSFAATYTLSDACLAAGKPLISASALGLGGYVGGFCGGAPSIRAVFPDLPRTLATCASAGVLGPVVGILGAMQAQMALLVLLALTPSPLGQLVSVDLKRHAFGGFRFDGAPEPEDPCFSFIARDAIGPGDIVIELRDPAEAPQAIHPGARRANVADFEAGSVDLDPDRRVVMCCRSGLRAWRAAAALRSRRPGPIALLAAGEPA
jgi:molybdopterin/thiamine biosynthesis adenylyltransferase